MSALLVLALFAPPAPPEVPDPVGAITPPTGYTRLYEWVTTRGTFPCVARVDEHKGGEGPFEDGDVIETVGATKMTAPDDYLKAWRHYRPGARVAITVVRGGQRVVVEWECR